jgi:adenosylcobinamide-phosphate synthase
MSTFRQTIGFDRAALVLIFAAIVDYLIGDPWGWLHPVQALGWVISFVTKLTIKYCQQKWLRRLVGIVLGTGLIIGSAAIAWSIVLGFNSIAPWLGLVVEIIMLASCFAGKSLRNAAVDVLQSLCTKNLETARFKLSQYVGRDTANLSKLEILRATLETVAENTTDGVTAPLFYAILGAFIPGVGSAPLAIAYKAASTLDSSIGYLREPYTDIGWFSARLEDKLTWLPCRLTVLTLALLSGKPIRVWQICQRDGVKDPSPNSGWSEAVFAAILKVQLGGENSYAGVIKKKPLLGDDVEEITPAKVEFALSLMRCCFLLWLAIGLVGLLVWG